ncbi:MAG: hypothetical protein AB1467_04590 [Candidatus Diapherotrites archaeon]
MFNKKGQSALEYLMTYGWALVVIVVVIAVLYILVGTPTANSCGNFGTDIPVINHKVGTTDMNIVFSNGTAGTMNSYSLTLDSGTVGSNSYTSVAGTCSPATNLPAASQARCSVVLTGTANDSYRLNFSVAYTDKDGFSRSKTTTCTGKV